MQVKGLAQLRFADPFKGPLQHKNRRFACGESCGFVFDILIQASLERLSKTKPATIVTGFCVVGDEGFEPPTLWV